MSTSETATCIDCGLDVTYNDDGFWPWRGIDGSDICNRQTTLAGNEVRSPHRVNRAVADEIFKSYQDRTGTKASHR